MQWIINNLGAMIALVGVVFGLVATYVLYGADIKQLKKDSERLDGEHRELQKQVQGHNADTSLHIDPHRDKRIWDEFKSETFRRFDRLEEKIEKLMITVPPPPSH